MVEMVFEKPRDAGETPKSAVHAPVKDVDATDRREVEHRASRVYLLG